MLSIGWSEMLIVAAVALIVVGPRDLPAMLRQIGRFAGTIRKMGNEFRAELNKVTAIDEVRDIRKSITDPIRSATADIRSEFNKITPEGVVPSGKLKPFESDGENVVNQIHAQAGITGNDPARDAARKSMETAVQSVKAQADAAKLAAENAVKSKPANKAKTASKTKPRATAKQAVAAPAKAQTAKSAAPAKPSARPKSEQVAKPDVKTAAAKSRTKTKSAKV